MLSLTSIKTILLTLAVMTATTSPEKGFAQQAKPNGGWVTRNGNVFELSQQRLDTFVVVNPVTEEESIKIRVVDPSPAKMNGKSIAEKVDKAAYFTAPDKNLTAYLIRSLNQELSLLPDGRYTLNLWNVVTDEKGKVVYFDFDGVRDLGSPDATRRALDKQLQQRIVKRGSELLYAAPAFIPASLNGKNVPAYTRETSPFIRVRDHKVHVD